ncbi:hypothetical protein QWZ13_16150 [Reinekea marina]|uniref:Tetratricopeptide repeat protein n=1 Tax=Reinekea marina TaxID=1310421 RepID=A0ABV7WQ34_9GAMM|nr:hypothetical protein [Reinekea marina]MDN3650441.1 hypothetical protein [Reinekea marina]
MKNNYLYVLFLLTFISFSGCASFYAQQAGLVGQVEIWRENDQYDIALETISKLEADHQNYQQLKALTSTLEKERSAFIKKVLNDADGLSATQDWVGATNLIDQALQRLPSAPELIEQRRYYDDKRLARVEMDKAAILIAKAKYFITARPHQESMLYNANSRFFASTTFNNFNSQAKQTSRELYVLGARYWQDKQAVQAREALTLSIQTAPNSLSEDLLSEVLAFEQQQRRDARNNNVKKIDDQWPELVQSYKNRIEHDDYLGAERIINEMSALGFEETKAYKDRFELLKLQRVKALTQRGNKLYNSGLIAEAIESWEQAQRLAPGNNTIAQNLERARTFLGNLERWSDEPNSSEAP